MLRDGLNADTPKDPGQPRVVRRHEAARMLARSLRSVDMLAAQGLLRRIKLPGRKRGCGFLESDLLALLEIK